MRILIFHGYLLSGTGSNVYNARLARTLVHLGHEVHLLAQERNPGEHRFIDAVGDWDSGDLRVTDLRTDAPPACTLYRPPIGSLLPVYVEDRYQGFEAKSFASCSDAELVRYLDANVRAVRDVQRRARAQIALANHVLMGPAILARALADGACRYAVKAHGSALEYTLKPDLERFLPYAREGLAAAEGVLVGSRHTGESLLAALGEEWCARHGMLARLRVCPPGVDVEAFAPASREQAAARLSKLASQLARSQSGGSRAKGALAAGSEGSDAPTSDAPGRATTETSRSTPNGGAKEETPNAAAKAGRSDPTPDRGAMEETPNGGANEETPNAGQSDSFARDDALAARALRQLHPAIAPTVAYVGKLIVAKGVDLLIAAWPLVLQVAPSARLVIVGFGALGDPLRNIVSALQAGDLGALRSFACEARDLEAADGLDAEGPGGQGHRPLRFLLRFLDSLHGHERDAYLLAAQRLSEFVLFTGRLEHDALAQLLPACEAIVVPSTFPEAFGMVAVEGAACGALPISAAHSGLVEVSDVLARGLRTHVGGGLEERVGDLLSFPLDENAVRAIAERLKTWLALPRDERDQSRQALAAIARSRWSWEAVAEGVLQAAQGDLRGLPAVREPSRCSE